MYVSFKINLLKDQELIKELRNHNRKAFEILIDEFQQKVFHSCLSFVPNKEDAEDITQEVFLEVYKSISGFKADAKLSTWIYKITTNKCLEFIRRKNTKKRFGYKQSIDNLEFGIDQQNYFTEFNNPGVVLENKEKAQLLYRTIHTLPESQRVVFTLVKIDGKSYQEVVDITGKSLSSIESIMFRAKKSLREKLQNFYNQEKNDR